MVTCYYCGRFFPDSYERYFVGFYFDDEIWFCCLECHNAWKSKNLNLWRSVSIDV